MTFEGKAVRCTRQAPDRYLERPLRELLLYTFVEVPTLSACAAALVTLRKTYSG